MIDKNVPGPGKYDYLKTFGYNANKYSMGERIDPKNKSKKSVSPGPGQYRLYSINLEGKYPVSDVKNITGIIWSHSKSKRFIYDKDKNPNLGAGKYNLGNLINGTGFSYVSKFKSSMGKTMSGRFFPFKNKNPSKSILYNNLLIKAPGPGSYTVFSEFGQYQSKGGEEFDKKMRNTHSNIKYSKTEA